MIALLHDLFAAPAWLWLLVPAIALTAWDLRRRWGSRGRRTAAAGVRLVMMGVLVAALADPRHDDRDELGHVIMVVDRSASIPDAVLDEALARADAIQAVLDADVEVGLVLFDADPEVAVFPGETWTVPAPPRADPVEGTDLSAALRLAMGLVPADDAGTIVVLSDGRSTDGVGAAASVVADAEARGVTIHAFALAPARGDPAVTAVELAEPTVRPGAPVEGRVEVDGTDQPVSGTVVVQVGGTEALRQRVEIPAGERVELPFTHPLDARTDPGTMGVTAELLPDGTDDDSANNEAGTTLVVGDPPQIRIFTSEDHDARSLARALRAERMDVQVVKIETSKDEDADLSEVDLVVLANAPAAPIGGGPALGPELLEELVRFVDRGGGLVVLGGPQSFDMGGYAGSPLARALPIELDPADAEIQAGATILIILDRSGSMSAMVGFSKTKMALADEGAAASIRLLRPFDRVGVMSVTELVRWEVPIQPVRDPAAIERKVMRIRSDGGGIFVYTSLEAAHRALAKTDTPLRHVILFSDAADSEEKVEGIPFGSGPGPTAEDLARKMRADNITTSVIGIGTEHDVDTPFLQALARAGGGRFYLTDDATKLRSLFVQETERLVDSSLHEGDFRPVAKQPHPIVEGIDYGAAPSLGGFQELRARPTAEVILEAAEGHPLLTTWRYGLGQVIAWSSDAGNRWSERWLSWNGYSRQWTQAARFALRDRAGDETAVEVDFAGHDARLRVARRDTNGLSLQESGLRARIREGDSTRELALSSDEPGMWEGRLVAEPGRSHTVEIVDADGQVLAEHTFAPPPSAERRHRTADTAALRTLAERTGGTLDPELIEPPTAASVTTDVHRLWPWLLVLSLALLPLDAFLRRPARVA